MEGSQASKICGTDLKPKLDQHGAERSGEIIWVYKRAEVGERKRGGGVGVRAEDGGEVGGIREEHENPLLHRRRKA